MAFDEARLNVPNGFRNLLECLTLEVLRENPTNIPKFAAEYFKERLVSRQEKGYDECLLGSQIDGFYRYEPTRVENTCSNDLMDSTVQKSFKKAPQSNTLSQTNPTSQDVAASKIQAGFHGYKCRQIKTLNRSAETIQSGNRGYAYRKDIENRNEAAIKIQAGFRGYRVRKEIMGNVKTDGKRGPTREFYRNQSIKKLTNEAATTVQAGYRGYRERREIARQSKASTKIQAGYRGYRERKDLKKIKDASVKIQATYRGYHQRKELKTKHKASTTIQSGYRGYRERKNQHSQSEAAVKIQAQYRGYRVRKRLKHGGGQSFSKEKDLLEVLHHDSRFSFSLPNEDVKFEGDLDSDSDIDIDKVVKEIEAKKQEFKDDSTDNGKGGENQSE